VGPHPLRGEVLNFCNAGPIILGQPLLANGPVEPLNVSILLRLTWLNIFKPDAPLLSPVLDDAADILRPVVAANHLRLAAPGNDLLQGPDHPLRGQREVHLNAQRLPVEVVDDIEQEQVATVFQPVVHEVHGPDLIGGLGHHQGLRLLAHQALPGFDAQVQLQFAVNAVHAFVVTAKPFDVA